MKLYELKEIRGTYVALRPTPATLALVLAWARENNVSLVSDPHVTVLYSRAPLQVSANPAEHLTTTLRFEAFNPSAGNQETAIVVELVAPTISARHDALIRAGGTHDFPEYRPHMTLFYGDAPDLSQLSPMNFGLTFAFEYSEALSE